MQSGSRACVQELALQAVLAPTEGGTHRWAPVAVVVDAGSHLHAQVLEEHGKVREGGPVRSHIAEARGHCQRVCEWRRRRQLWKAWVRPAVRWPLTLTCGAAPAMLSSARHAVSKGCAEVTGVGNAHAEVP